MLFTYNVKTICYVLSTQCLFAVKTLCVLQKIICTRFYLYFFFFLKDHMLQVMVIFLFQKVYKGRFIMINFYNKQDDLFSLSLVRYSKQSNRKTCVSHYFIYTYWDKWPSLCEKRMANGGLAENHPLFELNSWYLYWGYTRYTVRKTWGTELGYLLGPIFFIFLL